MFPTENLLDILKIPIYQYWRHYLGHPLLRLRNKIVTTIRACFYYKFSDLQCITSRLLETFFEWSVPLLKSCKFVPTTSNILTDDVG